MTPAMFYAGAAAAAIPILIHLLNRRRFRRIRWAAVEFLLQADRENRRRIRIEELILLALRCLAMAVAGVMLARWFIRPESLTAALGTRGQSERIVILDDSFSMGLRDPVQASESDFEKSGTVFSRAQSTLRDLVSTWRESSPDDGVTVLLTSRPDQPLRSEPRIGEINLKTFEEDLASTPVSFRPGNFPAAMAAVRQRLDALSAGADATVYVISDFQRIDWIGRHDSAGPDPSPAAALADWGRDGRSLHVVLIDVGNPADNLAIADIEPRQAQSVATIEGRYVARIVNFGRTPSAATVLEAYVGDAAVPATSVPSIDAGSHVDLAIDATFPNEGLDVLTVELPPDGLPVDNARRLVVPVARALRTLIVNGEKSPDPYEDETFLLTVALQPEGPQFSGNEVTVIDENDLEGADLSDYQVVVLANVYRFNESAVEHLETYVRSGGGLAIFLGDQVDADAYNRLLYREGSGLLPAKIGQVAICPAESAGWGIGEIDAAHPLTARLAAGEASLLQNVRVRECFRCEPGEAESAEAASLTQPASAAADERTPARILIRLNSADKDPLVVDQSLGRGHVVMFTSSTDKEWNNLPDQPAYVVWAMELVQYLARRAEAGGQQLVGAPIVIPFDGERYQPPATLKPPTFPADPASRIEPQPDPGTGQTVLSWTRTDEPGIYRFDLSEISGRTVTRPMAVNVDTRESDLGRADEAALRASMPNLNLSYVTGRDLAALRDVEVRRELWPIALILLVVVLMSEQALGWYFGSGRNLRLLWRGGDR